MQPPSLKKATPLFLSNPPPKNCPIKSPFWKFGRRFKPLPPPAERYLTYIVLTCNMYLSLQLFPTRLFLNKVLYYFMLNILLYINKQIISNQITSLFASFYLCVRVCVCVFAFVSILVVSVSVCGFVTKSQVKLENSACMRWRSYIDWEELEFVWER